MKERFRKEAERWFACAEDDREASSVLYDHKKYAQACFFLHQSAEKSLKAIYYFLGEEGWGHSLFSLIEDLKEIDKSIYDKFEGLKEEVKGIDRFYIPTRYPNGLIDILPFQAFGEKDYLNTEGVVDKILKITKEIIYGKS